MFFFFRNGIYFYILFCFFSIAVLLNKVIFSKVYNLYVHKYIHTMFRVPNFKR